jgi:hypothetical protein
VSISGQAQNEGTSVGCILPLVIVVITIHYLLKHINELVGVLGSKNKYLDKLDCDN